MSDSITKALNDTQRSYIASKASLSSMTNALLARGPSNALVQQSDFSKSKVQLEHFRGIVYSSVRPIAQKIAGQQIRVGKITGVPRTRRHAVESNVSEFATHRILDMLADPNELMVSWSLMYITVASLEITGRQLWWLPVIDGRRMVFPIPTPWIIDIKRSTRFEEFVIRPPNSTEEFTIPPDEVCYFALPHPGNLWGSLSPLEACGSAVDADEAMETSQHAMFRSIHPSHALIVGKNEDTKRRPRLTGPQHRQLIKTLRERYGGMINHGEPFILDSLVEDIKVLSRSAREMDYLRSGQVTRSRITQAFGTNPIIMGEVEGANRASSLAASEHFAEYTVNPLIRLLSETMTEWIGPMFDDQKLKIWIEPVKVHDPEMELARWNKARDNGDVTRNEYRSAVLGLPPTDDEVERNNLLTTVGGMQGAVQILTAAGQGFISSQQASELLQLFLEINSSLAGRIAGQKTVDSRMALAAEKGALSFNELREFCGLPPFPPAMLGDHPVGVQRGFEASMSSLVNRLVNHNVAGALERLAPAKNGDK